MSRYDYQQQQEQDRRSMEERGLDFAAYWAKREKDMKEQREFWRKWSARWDANKDWPFRSET